MLGTASDFAHKRPASVRDTRHRFPVRRPGETGIVAQGRSHNLEVVGEVRTMAHDELTQWAEERFASAETSADDDKAG